MKVRTIGVCCRFCLGQAGNCFRRIKFSCISVNLLLCVGLAVSTADTLSYAMILNSDPVTLTFDL